MKWFSFLLRHGFVVSLVVGIAIAYVYRQQLFPRFYEQQTSQTASTQQAEASVEETTKPADQHAATAAEGQSLTSKPGTAGKGIDSSPQASTAQAQKTLEQAATQAQQQETSSIDKQTTKQQQLIDETGAVTASAKTQAQEEASAGEVKESVSAALGNTSNKQVDSTQTLDVLSAETSLPSTGAQSTQIQESGSAQTAEPGTAQSEAVAALKPTEPTELGSQEAKSDREKRAEIQMSGAKPPVQESVPYMVYQQGQTAQPPGVMHDPQSRVETPVPGMQAPGMQAPGMQAPGMQAPGMQAPGMGGMHMPAPPSPAIAGQTEIPPEQRYNQLVNKARYAYWQNQYPQSVAHYQLAIKILPHRVDAYGELGNVYYSQGEWDKSGEQFYQAALRLLQTNRRDKAQHLLLILKGLRHQRASELEQRLQTQPQSR